MLERSCQSSTRASPLSRICEYFLKSESPALVRRKTMLISRCNRVESPGLPEPLSHSMAIQQAPALYSVNPRPDGSILFGARGHGYDKYVAHLAKDLVLNSTNDAVEFPEYRRELLRFSAKHLGM